MTTRSAVPLLFLCATLGVRADTLPKGEKALQGTWRWVEMTTDGLVVEREKFEDWRIVIKDDRYTVRAGNEVVSTGWLRVRGETSPKQIDREPDIGPDRGQVYKGIYRLERDGTLWTCWAFPNDDRPTDFASREGTRHLLLKEVKVKD